MAAELTAKLQCYKCGKYHSTDRGLKRAVFGRTCILYFCPTCPVTMPQKPLDFKLSEVEAERNCWCIKKGIK